MDDWVTILVVIVALLVIAGIIYWFSKGKERQLEQRRQTATEHRQEAQVAAQRAGQAEVDAQRQAERAEQERERAVALQGKAEKVDPDR